MAYISAWLRQEVTLRARGLCEYCQTQQIVVIRMKMDHIKPEVAGGLTDLNNLALACDACNQYKHHFQTAIDPKTDERMALFNPRLQVWDEHFRWNLDATELIGLTPTARATIERLKINRDEMIVARCRWHPPHTD